MRRIRQQITRLLLVPLLVCGMIPAASAGAAGKQPVQAGQQKAASAVNQLIVRYKDGVKTLSALKLDKSLKLVKHAKQTALIEVAPGQLKKVSEKLAHDPNVAYVEPNYVYQKAEAETDDDLFEEQWGLTAVDAPAAWEKLENWPNKRNQVVVAVVDTGVDATHPDLAGRVLPKGYNTIDDNEDTRDGDGHGTHVSGIVAAQTGNGIGVAGVAGKENVKILPIKALDDFGSGTAMSVATGVDKAVELGADVINMSLGGPFKSKLIEEAIDRAVAKGVLVVVAAGNSSDNADGYYPAALPEVVTVASVDEELKPSSFSNFGRAIDLAAPGEYIMSTVPDKDYDAWDGTSMATPFVAGAAALVKLAHPDWKAEQIRNALEKTAKDIDAPGRDISTGNGLVQVAAAISYDRVAPLSIVSPRQGETVWGSVPITVAVGMDGVTQVQFAKEDGTVLGQAPVTNGRAVWQWDSRQAANGNQTIVIQALDAGNRPVGQPERLALKVKNEAGQGTYLTVLDRDGKPAPAAEVSVMRYNDSYGGFSDPVVSTYTNNQGMVYLPQSVFLPGERYLAVIFLRDLDDEEMFTSFCAVKGGGEAVTIDFRGNRSLDVQVTKGGRAIDTSSTTFVFTPVVDGKEADEFSVFIEPDDEEALHVNLPPGDYVGEAIRAGESGQNYYLKQSFSIGETTQTITFDLSAAKKWTFSLPKWADSAYWYPYAFVGIPVKNGGSLYVTPDEAQYYEIDLLQNQDGKTWLYSLYPNEPVPSGKSGVISVPSAVNFLVLKDQPESGNGGKTVYQPGDVVSVNGVYTLGRFALTGIYQTDSGDVSEENALVVKHGKTGKPLGLAKKGSLLVKSEGWWSDGATLVGPDVALVNGDGEEVWRTHATGVFTIPDTFDLESGTYTVTVDLGDTPLAASVKPRPLKQIAIGVESGKTTVSLGLLDPSQQEFFETEARVIDPKTKEIVAEDYSYFGGRLQLEGLDVGKTYLFRIAGITSDGALLFANREIRVSSSRFTIDFSQKRIKPARVYLDELDSGTLVRLKQDDMVLPLFAIDDSAPYVWVDTGTYQLIAARTEGEQPYLYQTDIEVEKGDLHLNVAPDFSQMKQVQIASKAAGDTDWFVAVKLAGEENDFVPPMEEPGNDFVPSEDYTLFMLDPGSTLYVSEGDYDFVVGRMEKTGETTTATIFNAQPRVDKDQYVFRFGDTFNVKLQPDKPKYEVGEALTVDVHVADRYKNEISQIVLMTDYAENAAQKSALRLCKDKDGRWVVAAYDWKAQTYHPISRQSVRPEVELTLDKETIDRSKDEAYWTQYGYPADNVLKPGRYTLTWRVSLPFRLEGSTQITVVDPVNEN